MGEWGGLVGMEGSERASGSYLSIHLPLGC